MISATSTVSPASFRAPSRPQYIVGTPAKKVIFSPFISCQRGLASNLGSITTVAADRRGTVLDHRLAEGVEQGQDAQVRVGFSAELPNTASPNIALSRMLRCRSSAPFGCPVVPDV